MTVLRVRRIVATGRRVKELEDRILEIHAAYRLYVEQRGLMARHDLQAAIWKAWGSVNDDK